MTADLDVRLDAPLPRSLAVGKGTALFVCGTCFAPSAPIESLSFLVDGEPQPVNAYGMPRLDLLRTIGGTPEDPLEHSYRSGFWGTVKVGARANGELDLSLTADLRGGASATANLAALPVEEPPPAADCQPPTAAGPLVAICMATHEPPMELFRRQVESIRAQTHGNWACMVSDDCSSRARFAELEAELAGDPRFAVSRSPRRLGFYGNFERALAMAPAEADYVAMADQDDRWHQDKLATLLDHIGAGQLAYSDARLVTPDGELLADTYWALRRNNHTSISTLLMANTVTGAASLLRRDLLDYALPFPPAQFAHFHDHWIALTALALGEIEFVDRPLYDYTQHDSAVLGHAAANRRTEMRERLAKVCEDPRERVRRWRMHYFVDNCRLTQFITVLEMRCGDRMARAKRRALARFRAAETSPAALSGLGLRAVRELAGTPRTLGAEVGLFFAFLWRRLVALSAGRGQRPRRRLRLDAVPPPNLAPRPGRRGPEGAAPRTIAEKIAPLELLVRDDVPERVNLLVPTIDLKHFFGGYIAKFNLARRLAERGARVRVVTVDPVGPLPRAWRREVEGYAGLRGMFESVEVEWGRESQGIEVSRGDRFIATTWWTAHVADAAVRALETRRFLYLIQEYEPFTFPMGTWAALAEESYRFDHAALFSTDLLRDFFRRREIGVYANGGDAASAAFQNAITPVEPPTAQELAARNTRRLLFYARPEPHAARNMFELGLLAIDRALGRGAFRDWELHGIGTVEAGRRVSVGGGAALDVLPRAAQADYAGVLRDHDVGLALMHTPHPSLVPIEMASAGMLTVTNSFENKTAEAMAEISPNITAAEPGIEAIAAALCNASEAAGDLDRRVAGSRVGWSRSWDDSFDDGLMDRVSALLDR